MKGYIFNFEGHGAFSPEGKVSCEMSEAEIKQHNYALGVAEAEAMKVNGRGVLYLFRDAEGHYSVGTWASEPYQRIAPWRVSRGRHNWGCQRTDVWFNADGATWHGVNIGDNDILRCKRNKG